MFWEEGSVSVFHNPCYKQLNNMTSLEAWFTTYYILIKAIFNLLSHKTKNHKYNTFPKYIFKRQIPVLAQWKGIVENLSDCRYPYANNNWNIMEKNHSKMSNAGFKFIKYTIKRLWIHRASKLYLVISNESCKWNSFAWSVFLWNVYPLLCI